MSIKCGYYDKGYCKSKTNCAQRHPPLDCDGQCKDKITCSKRHRVQCKNGTSCIYFQSNSCEFLHTVGGQEQISQNTIEQMETNKKDVETKLIDIEARLSELYESKFAFIIKTFELKLISTVSKLEVRVKVLEDENINLKNKFREYNKVGEENVTTKNAFTEEENETSRIQQTQNNIEFKHPRLECSICKKEFKTKIALNNHDEKYHIIRGQFGSGSFSYKCDNCNKKFTEKNTLEHHIAQDHIKCSICQKVFPTISSLNIHITAVHDNLKMKHKLEREPSLKNHKIKRPA